MCTSTRPRSQAGTSSRTATGDDHRPRDVGVRIRWSWVREGRQTTSAPNPSIGAGSQRARSLARTRSQASLTGTLGRCGSPVFARIWGQSSASSAPSIWRVSTPGGRSRHPGRAAAFLCARSATVRACTPPVTARLRSRREPEPSRTSRTMSTRSRTRAVRVIPRGFRRVGRCAGLLDAWRLYQSVTATMSTSMSAPCWSELTPTMVVAGIWPTSTPPLSA